MPRKKKIENNIHPELLEELNKICEQYPNLLFVVKDFTEEGQPYILVAKRKELEGVSITSRSLFTPHQVRFKRDFLVLALIQYASSTQVATQRFLDLLQQTSYVPLFDTRMQSNLQKWLLEVV
ncbi:MAG TPA: hypothetical protein VHA52_10040 [Candidatus Babeliaceae bacterium]|nr:hypothetical protein [Candidatus Babeliaceae bacterium]